MARLLVMGDAGGRLHGLRLWAPHQPVTSAEAVEG